MFRVIQTLSKPYSTAVCPTGKGGAAPSLGSLAHRLQEGVSVSGSRKRSTSNVLAKRFIIEQRQAALHTAIHEFDTKNLFNLTWALSHTDYMHEILSQDLKME